MNLVEQNPEVAHALFVIEVMSERLSFANRAMSALQR
jgi:hypothetical protein